MSEVFVVRNDSGGDLEIEDFGMTIADGVVVDLRNYDAAILSADLLTKLTSGDLVRVIDGTDVSVADCLKESVDNQAWDIDTKGTPIGADSMVIQDSADSDTKKKVLLSSLPDPTKIRRYLVSQRVRVGSGGGAATTGKIQDAPVILFNDSQDQEAFFANHIKPGVDLSSVNPILEFHFVSGSTVPGVGTETVRWQLQIRYRGAGEGIDGAYDETLAVDIELPTGTAFVHFDKEITLDRTKMAIGDLFTVRMVRLADTGGTDDYDDNIGFTQASLVFSGTGGV